MPTIIDDETARQILLSEPATTPEGHPETVTRPSWLTRPCPSWCTTVHEESDYYIDRHHFDSPLQPLDLSLYDDARGEQNKPGELSIHVSQHYRQAEPTVSLVMPRHQLGRSEVTGEMDLDLTADEARELRDRLSLILATVDGAPLDTELGEPLGGATRRSAEHVTRLGLALRSDVTIASSLLQWVEPGSGPDLEVEVDIASNPDTYSPAQAREVAAQLREAADHIARLAEAAEQANAAMGGAK